jgi:hypothetical protein
LKKKLLILVLQVGSGFADFHYTNRNAHTPNFVEHDSIARPFVSNGTIERAAFFGVYAGGAIAGGELLEHFGHNKLSLLLRAAQIEENSRGAIYSATHFK